MMPGLRLFALTLPAWLLADWQATQQFFLHTLLGRSIIGYVLIFTVPAVLPVLFIRLVGFKGLRHLFSYEPKPSIVHRLDPRLKVLYPTLMGLLSVFLNWQYVYILVAFSVIPWLLLRPSQQRTRVILTMMAVPLIGTIWSQGLFHTEGTSTAHLLFVFPPTLSWLGTPGLSSTGLIYGLQQAGRTLAGVSSSLILLFTTTPSEVVWAFYKFRLPAPVGLAFTAALRFLPQMIERMTVLLQVVQSRGYDLSVPRWWQIARWPGYIGRVFACIPIVTIPLLIGSLRTTSVMAMVVDARAFNASPKRGTLHARHTTLSDVVALIALIALTALVAWLAISGVGARRI